MHDHSFLLPQHVAIVMDGNARWAKNHHMPISSGHLRGVFAVRRVVRLAIENTIPYLTLYAFSFNNWSRSSEEVNFLMSLFQRFLIKEIHRFKKYGVRVVIIGDREDLLYRAPSLEEPIHRTENETKLGTKLYLQIAINYSGQKEICHAFHKAFLAGKIINNVDDIRPFLYLAPYVPMPDLFIRTSGEQRLSDFLLWYLGYTELYFCSDYWPAFGREQWCKALTEYSRRQRRFGARPERTFK